MGQTMSHPVKKIVQTAEGGKRPRRQIMAKSNERNNMNSKIQANMFMTELDRQHDKNEIENSNTLRVVAKVKE